MLPALTVIQPFFLRKPSASKTGNTDVKVTKLPVGPAKGIQNVPWGDVVVASTSKAGSKRNLLGNFVLFLRREPLRGDLHGLRLRPETPKPLKEYTLSLTRVPIYSLKYIPS